MENKEYFLDLNKQNDKFIKEHVTFNEFTNNLKALKQCQD